MAKRKKTVKAKKENKIKSFFKNQQTHLGFGVFFVLLSIFLLSSFVSFFSHWYQDKVYYLNLPQEQQLLKTD